jgi:hypothetical protein
MLENLFNPQIELKNKFNIDPTEILVKFLSVIDNDTNYEEQFKKFIYFLESKINRKISDHEQLDFSVAVLDYIQSEPATQERTQIMKKIFNL